MWGILNTLTTSDVEEVTIDSSANWKPARGVNLNIKSEEDTSDSCSAKRLNKAMSPGSMTLPTMNNWDMSQSMSPYIPPDMNSKSILWIDLIVVLSLFKSIVRTDSIRPCAVNSIFPMWKRSPLWEKRGRLPIFSFFGKSKVGTPFLYVTPSLLHSYFSCYYSVPVILSVRISFR